jgi:hypothetical protein
MFKKIETNWLKGIVISCGSKCPLNYLEMFAATA